MGGWLSWLIFIKWGGHYKMILGVKKSDAKWPPLQLSTEEYMYILPNERRTANKIQHLRKRKHTFNVFIAKLFDKHLSSSGCYIRFLYNILTLRSNYYKPTIWKLWQCRLLKTKWLIHNQKILYVKYVIPI